MSNLDDGDHYLYRVRCRNCNHTFEIDLGVSKKDSNWLEFVKAALSRSDPNYPETHVCPRCDVLAVVDTVALSKPLRRTTIEEIQKKRGIV